MKSEKVLVLRTCANDMADHCGLIWSVSGLVECKYWEPTKKIENGLVGSLWGQGSSAHLSMQADARWVVCEVAVRDLIFLEDDGVVKFSRAEVVHVGTRGSALDYISDNAPDFEASTKNLIETFIYPDMQSETSEVLHALPAMANSLPDVIKPRITVRATQTLETAVYGSTLTGANQSQLIAGYGSTETAGDSSTLIAGYGSTGTSGSDSSIIAGYGSTQTAGDESSLMAGYGSTQTANTGSDLTAGYGSTGTAGSDSSLIAGYGSTQTAGWEAP